MDHPAFELTDTQQKVLTAVYALFERNNRPVSNEEISAETLLPPDVVVRAVTVLVEAHRLQVYEPENDNSELQLEVAGAGR